MRRFLRFSERDRLQWFYHTSFRVYFCGAGTSRNVPDYFRIFRQHCAHNANNRVYSGTNAATKDSTERFREGCMKADAFRRRAYYSTTVVTVIVTLWVSFIFWPERLPIKSLTFTGCDCMPSPPSQPRDNIQSNAFNNEVLGTAEARYGAHCVVKLPHSARGVRNFRCSSDAELDTFVV